jgi:hypothetical protein
MKVQPRSKTVPPAPQVARDWRLNFFAAVSGAFMGLCLLKFGNPIVMEKYFAPPATIYNWVLTSWKATLGWKLLGVVTVVGFFAVRRRTDLPRWLIALPLVWLLWQCLAATRSIDPVLTKPTLAHFLGCTVCFYLGALALGRSRSLGLFSVGLAIGFLFVLGSGFEQHFGGLEESKHYFFAYFYPAPTNSISDIYQQGLIEEKTNRNYAAAIGDYQAVIAKTDSHDQFFATVNFRVAECYRKQGLTNEAAALQERIRREYPDQWQALVLSEQPAYLKKMAGKRIFATLFYPNTLAGVILMVLPVVLGVVWSAREHFTLGARRFLVGLIGLSSLLCLYWSGSKGGWLIILVIALVGSLFLPLKRQFKVLFVVGGLIVGLAGFGLKYAGFFEQGATSVVARFDYWRAAARICLSAPVFGTGPGTFAKAYERIKKPESEMARVTHNDYLEQGSDSGVVGLVSFTALVVGTLTIAFRKGFGTDWVRLGVWLGVLGWAIQSTVEFGLYIPAVGWLAFCLMGWLAARSAFPQEPKVEPDH